MCARKGVCLSITSHNFEARELRFGTQTPQNVTKCSEGIFEILLRGWVIWSKGLHTFQWHGLKVILDFWYKNDHPFKLNFFWGLLHKTNWFKPLESRSWVLASLFLLRKQGIELSYKQHHYKKLFSDSKLMGTKFCESNPFMEIF